MYYIKNGYVGNAILWWGKDSRGYTTDIRNAGKYTEEQARNICKCRVQDTAYPCEYIDTLEEARKIVIDSQYLRPPEEWSES